MSGPPSSENGSRRSRWRVAGLYAIALLPFLTLAALEWPSHPDLDGSDYAQYKAHALALLEGRPYTDTGYLYTELESRFSPQAYPPGWPASLAAAFVLFGRSDGVAKGLTLLFACALLLGAGAYLGRRTSHALGAATVLLLGLSPLMVTHSVAPLSDVPFAAAVWWTILLADRHGHWAAGRAMLVTVAAGVAVLLRPHGMILVGALGIWGIAVRRERGPWALAPAGALGLAIAIGRSHLPATAVRAFQPPREMAENLVTVRRVDVLAVFEGHLYPFHGDLPNDVYHVVSFLLMAVGIVAFARRYPRSSGLWFAAVYALGLAITSFGAIESRFAIPILPVTVFGLLYGVAVLASRWNARARTIAPVVLAGLLAVVTTFKAFTVERPPPLRSDPAYLDLLDVVGSRAGAGVRLVSFRPRYIALETGVPGMPTLRVEDIAAHFDAWCRGGITHVLLGDMELRPSGDRATRSAIASRPEAFSLEYFNDEFELYRFDPALGCRSSR